MDKNPGSYDKNIVFFFFLIPAFILIVGYFIFPYPPPSLLAKQLVYIPLFPGLILLGIIYSRKRIGKSYGPQIFKKLSYHSFASSHNGANRLWHNPTISRCNRVWYCIKPAKFRAKILRNTVFPSLDIFR